MTFHLSEPGAHGGSDPALTEYLRCYGFPQPPEVRYGLARWDSPSARNRVSLFGQAWVPSHAQGTVYLLHGFSEHSGNYSQLVNDLLQQRFAVAAMDMRGHGLSEGSRGHVEGPEVYRDDFCSFFELVRPHILPQQPVYLWAHSLGALVALQVILARPTFFQSAVLSSPLLGFPEIHGARALLAKLAPLLAKIMPTISVEHGIAPTFLSHDEAYLARRLEDPFVGRSASPAWLVSVAAAIETTQKHASSYGALCPTLLLLAGDERITNLSDARRFAFHAYSNLRHKVIEFPGCYHEIEKEPAVRERVLNETVGWYRTH
jgi:acylglycerol lipase